MPIPIFSAPEDIINSIIGKFDFLDYLNFHQSSQRAYECSTDVKKKYLLPATVEKRYIALEYFDEMMTFKFGRSEIDAEEFIDCPLRFEDYTVNVVTPFTEEFCDDLMDFLQKTNSSIGILDFRTATKCSIEAFEDLYDAGRVEEMHFEQLKQDEILSLNVPNFVVRSAGLTSIGLNYLLHQLLDGKRTIDYCVIGAPQGFHQKLSLKGIPTEGDSFVYQYLPNIIVGIDKTYAVSFVGQNVIIYPDECDECLEQWEL